MSATHSAPRAPFQRRQDAPNSGAPAFAPVSAAGRFPRLQRPKESARGAAARREAAASKATPIWLGSWTRQGPTLDGDIDMDIRLAVPEDWLLHETVLAIEKFETDAARLEAECRHLLAAECLEQGVSARQRLLGDSVDYVAAVERYVTLCNVWGVWCLNCGQFSSSLELLKKAEAATEADATPLFTRRITLRTETFMNLCCYFRRRNKLNAAQQYAERALRMLIRYKDPDTAGRIHLAYAALLSGSRRHEKAVEHIESAMAFLHDEIQRHSGTGGEAAHGRSQETPVVLVAAHHNMFVEMSCLGRREAALESLRRANTAAAEKLGARHPMAQRIAETLSQLPEEQAWAGQAELQVAPRAPSSDPASASRPAKRHNKFLTPLDERMADLVESQRLTLRHADLEKKHQGQPKPPPPRKPGEKPAFRRAAEQFAPNLLCHVPWLPTNDERVREPFFESREKLSDSTQWWCSKMGRGKESQPGSRSAGATGGGGSAAKGRPGTAPMEAAYARFYRQEEDAKGWTEAPEDPGAFQAAEVAHESYRRRRTVLPPPEAPAPPGPPTDFPDPPRLNAINIVRSRMEKRRERGMPAATEESQIWAATVIQAAIRGHLARKWPVEELAQEARRARSGNFAAMVSDHAGQADEPSDMKRWEAYLIVHAARMALREDKCAIKIQKLFRGWLTRRDIQEQVSLLAHVAAKRIQERARSWLLLREHRLRQKAAKMLQATSRQQLQRLNAQEGRVAAHTIGRVLRGCLVRSRLRSLVRAAVLLQAAGRGWLTRRRAARRASAAVAVQRRWRGSLARRRLAGRQYAAARLQAALRGFATRKVAQRRRRAAVAVQALVRSHQCRLSIGSILASSTPSSPEAAVPGVPRPRAAQSRAADPQAAQSSSAPTQVARLQEVMLPQEDVWEQPQPPLTEDPAESLAARRWSDAKLASSVVLEGVCAVSISPDGQAPSS